MSSSSSTISSLVFAIAVLDREAHSKCAPFAHLAFHPNAAPVRLHNHLGLKHADAEPLLLCALKRAEQAVPEERLAHATTIVRDGENGAASYLVCADVNAP